MQVILVGHDFGGACISYIMELFPSKISKAIFIAAAMLSTGQSTLDMYSQQVVLYFIILGLKKGGKPCSTFIVDFKAYMFSNSTMLEICLINLLYFNVIP